MPNFHQVDFTHTALLRILQVLYPSWKVVSVFLLKNRMSGRMRCSMGPGTLLRTCCDILTFAARPMTLPCASSIIPPSIAAESEMCTRPCEADLFQVRGCTITPDFEGSRLFFQPVLVLCQLPLPGLQLVLTTICRLLPGTPFLHHSVAINGHQHLRQIVGSQAFH